MEEVIVFGHKSPDTDTICSAIVMADLQTKIRGEKVTPCRLGEINEETKFALKKFNVEAPKFIEKVEEGQKIEYVLNTEEVSILTEMALIYWGEQNYKVALEIYQFLVGQYEKSFIKPVFHILDWGMSMGNYGMALEELGYFEKAIGVCRKRIQQTLFAGKGGSLHTSLMVEACILEAQKDVKCKKYFKQDLDLLRLYKMQTNYKLMESYVKTNKIFD